MCQVFDAANLLSLECDTRSFNPFTGDCDSGISWCHVTPTGDAEHLTLFASDSADVTEFLPLGTEVAR